MTFSDVKAKIKKTLSAIGSFFKKIFMAIGNFFKRTFTALGAWAKKLNATQICMIISIAMCLAFASMGAGLGNLLPLIKAVTDGNGLSFMNVLVNGGVQAISFLVVTGIIVMCILRFKKKGFGLTARILSGVMFLCASIIFFVKIGNNTDYAEGLNMVASIPDLFQYATAASVFALAMIIPSPAVLAQKGPNGGDTDRGEPAQITAEADGRTV